MDFLVVACCPEGTTAAADDGSSLQMADIKVMALELKNMVFLFESVFIKKRLESEIVVVDDGTMSKSWNGRRVDRFLTPGHMLSKLLPSAPYWTESHESFHGVCMLRLLE